MVRRANHVKPTTSLRRIGLARALSKLGYCSRSQASDLIRAGRVRLNGALRRDPEIPVHLEKDRIVVDGLALRAESNVYLVLNKRRGLVTTAADELDRETVYASLPAELPWVSPVGRLDKASEGLLLFTNDSEWSARVLAPQTHLDKTYHVQVKGMVEAAVPQMMMLAMSEGGDSLRAKAARILRRGERNTWLEVVLDEGRNRQIRRMLAQFGIEVLRLVRVAIGPLELGKLSKGAFRLLTAEEKLGLDAAMAGSRAELRSPRLPARTGPMGRVNRATRRATKTRLIS
jgi:23S rRNA pseudouridine2605 synthase